MIKFLKAPNYILKLYKERIQSVFTSFSREISDIIEKKTSKIDNFSRIIKLPKSLITLKNKMFKPLLLKVMINQL